MTLLQRAPSSRPAPADARMQWPDGTKCMVAITVDFDGASNEIGKGLYPGGSSSHGLYSARRGVPRLLRVFDRQGIRVTFFVPGKDAELFPEAVLSIHQADHEVAAHGYLHEYWDVGDKERELLAKTHQILTDLTGRAPRGWRSPSGRKTPRTTAVLRELGYIYDASEKDDDIPYLPVVDGHVCSDIVVIPNNATSVNDTPYYRTALRPPSEVLANWKDEFDASYRNSGYFVLTMHPRAGFGSGTPSRASMVEEFIGYIRRHPGVRFVRMAELASICLNDQRDLV